MKINLLVALLFFILLVSCSPAKLVPEGKQWYHASEIKVEGKLSTEAQNNLPLLIKQKPNKKSLFWRSFRLDWYNFMAGSNKPVEGNWVKRNWRRFTNWNAKTIGVEPVVYDNNMSRNTVVVMKDYLKSKGYYFATVRDTVQVDSVWLFRDPKVTACYRVRAGKPYIIRNISYQFPDDSIRAWVVRDSTNCLVKSGQLFDADVLQAERQRITDSLKTHGYYRFAKEYLFYKVSRVGAEGQSDSAHYLVDVSMHLKPYVDRIQGKDVVYNFHPIFRIKNLYVYPNYNPQEAIRQGGNYYNKMDTATHASFNYLHQGKSKLRYPTLERGLFFKLGERYNSNKITRSTAYLNTLSAIKLTNAYFRAVDDTAKADTINYLQERWLNCYLNTTSATRQSYSVDLEGNYASEKYFGIDGSLNYRHKNLFRGSEDLVLAYRMAWARNTLGLEDQSSERGFNFIRYGIDAELTVPKFIVPPGFEAFNKRYTPKTRMGLGFSYERRPDFNNQNANASFGYRWRSSENTSHFFNVIDLFGTQILNISDSYRDTLIKRNLLADYSDKIIAAMNYTFVKNKAPQGIFDNGFYLRSKVELAGNLLVGASKLLGREKRGNQYFKDGDFPMYHFLNSPISQYAKVETDWRYYYAIDHEQRIAYRVFLGVGVPYGNFPAMPSHKQYMSGGMNGLRGWAPGYVGPGNFSYDIAKAYSSSPSLNQQRRGEMKFEMNIEYRLKLGAMFETAFFLDLGNTWTLSENNFSAIIADELNQKTDEIALQEPIQTAFSAASFYKQIAYNTGFGLRFDLSFFVLRLDLGAKIKDPGDDDAGIFKSKGLFRLNNWRLNFGIGYPF